MLFHCVPRARLQREMARSRRRGAPLLAALPAIAQTNQPVAEDLKPSVLNQPGPHYP